MYIKSHCLECPDCGDVVPCLNPETDPEYCTCGTKLLAVSCHPEGVPPVFTGYWDDSAWMRWTREQVARQARLEKCHELALVGRQATP